MARIWFRWWFAPLAILILGGLLCLGGLVYGSLFAGVPYQDATPVQQAEYDRHIAVFENICLAGFLIALIGVAAFCLSLAVNMVRSRRR